MIIGSGGTQFSDWNRYVAYDTFVGAGTVGSLLVSTESGWVWFGDAAEEQEPWLELEGPWTMRMGQNNGILVMGRVILQNYSWVVEKMWNNDEKPPFYGSLWVFA